MQDRLIMIFMFIFVLDNLFKISFLKNYILIDSVYIILFKFQNYKELIIKYKKIMIKIDLEHNLSSLKIP